MLDNLKVLLGLGKSDTTLDEKLDLLLASAEGRLKLLLGAETVPPQLSYIVTEVAVIRFNKIGSEGLASHTVAGEHMAFVSDDFAGYKSDIQAYLDGLEDAKRGRLRFL